MEELRTYLSDAIEYLRWCLSKKAIGVDRDRFRIAKGHYHFLELQLKDAKPLTGIEEVNTRLMDLIDAVGRNRDNLRLAQDTNPNKCYRGFLKSRKKNEAH